MWGGATALDAAIAKGDVKKIVDEGQEFFNWREIKTGQRGHAGTNTTVASGTANISDEQYKMIAETIATMKYIPNFTKAEEKAIAFISIIRMNSERNYVQHPIVEV